MQRRKSKKFYAPYFGETLKRPRLVCSVLGKVESDSNPLSFNIAVTLQ